MVMDEKVNILMIYKLNDCFHIVVLHVMNGCLVMSS